MRDWIAGFVGEDLATGAMLVIVTAAIVLAFLVLFAIFKGFSGSGIRSSRRTRQARLAVMDAAIVDSRRRLVLVRRDDIEHLILIGGPTDVVVEQNIIRSGSTTSTNTAISRGTNAPAAQAVPAAVEEMPAAIRPVPAPPARAPSSTPPTSNPSVDRSSPPPSPQIRPATKPPAPQVPMASASAVMTRETVAAVETPRSAPAVATPPVQSPFTQASSAQAPSAQSPSAQSPSAQSPSAQSMAQAAPVGTTTTPPGAAKKGRYSPVLAQASASTASLAAAATAPVATMAASVAQSKPLATPLTTPPATPSIENTSSTPAQASDDIAENQLADFEDNLAMNLGETLVAEDESSADKSDLANEMDELLSEITSGARS